MNPPQHPDPRQPTALPTAWNILHQAITQRRSVQARYHDKLRVLSPHALGWKNGRAKALVYQTTIYAPTSATNPQGWRSLYIDDIQDAVITDDQWQTAHNYTPQTTGIDTLAHAISIPPTGQ
jgi:predicted DNA-binding transcriptional regulator YafY